MTLIKVVTFVSIEHKFIFKITRGSLKFTLDSLFTCFVLKARTPTPSVPTLSSLVFESLSWEEILSV